MSIAVIIPANNGARFLSRTIESVLAQDYTDWSLTIVDDGSADGTADVACAYADGHDRISLVRQPNADVGSARNRGLTEADPACEHLIFLDHDDVWEPNALGVLLGALERMPRAVAASGLSRMVDSDGGTIEPGWLEAWGRDRMGAIGSRLGAWPSNAPTTLAVLAFKNCIWSPGQILIRRSALAVAGPFDATLRHCADWDMWLRLSLLGDIAFVDQVVLNWRLHDRNGSYQVERISRGNQLVRQKLLDSVDARDDRYRILLTANWWWSRRICSARLRHAHARLRNGELRLAVKHYALAAGDNLRSIRGVPVADAALYRTLRDLYLSARSAPSDINQHLETLRSLAQFCKHVTEFGTREGISTIGLLAARMGSLVSYDRVRHPSVDLLDRVAREEGRTHFIFHQADVLDVEIDETDLLFIDTWHVYEQLREELRLHAGRVRKFIALHNTTTFGEVGEAPGSVGLWPAVEEFLHHNREWTVAARVEYNNGLTILSRSNAAVPHMRSAPRRTPVYGREG